ncbi:MAG TPA: RluA family pseudouridine synthase [Candidatus Saccharimonadales bacterium]|nr:RluA family pseudouridine synthase [Candidatus Saccharimonadales bacterium]
MANRRLDTVVAEKTNTSRSFASKLIDDGKVRLKGEVLNKPSKKISDDADLKIDFNKNVKHAKLKLKVIYEDEDCLVVDKPSGILTHSKGAFNPEATLATWLHEKASSLDKDDQRSGIVHRLDRGTSGVILLAKNENAQKHFQKQFAKRNVKKTYIALVEGLVNPPEAVIDIPLARNSADPKRFKVSKFGKPAQTTYKILKTFTYQDKEYSEVELRPKTGRTHQIRLHLKYLNKPIIGDDFYGGIEADRLYLHAAELEITMPDSTRKKFNSPLPKDFLKPKIN